MKRLISVLLSWGLVLAADYARADPLSIEVPGEGWSLTFDPPAMKEAPLSFQPKGFAYAATAGRLNVSFYVDPPTCPGGEAADVRLKCFMALLAQNRMVVPESVRSTIVETGVIVVYGIRLETPDGTIRQLHSHVLFHKRGKEADFHASIVQPDDLDGRSLSRLISSVRVIDQ